MEACKIQFEELQFKESQTLEIKKQHLHAQMAKMKLDQEMEKRQRIDFDRKELEMEERLKEKWSIN